MPAGALYAKIGPSIFPYATAVGLGVSGIALLWTAGHGMGSPSDATAAPSLDRRALAWLGAGLAANVVLIGPLGFIAASTVLFACVARAFGSRRPLRDAPIGFALAAVTHQAFIRLLGLDLGSGTFAGF